jgi:hypothetical protein
MEDIGSDIWYPGVAEKITFDDVYDINLEDLQNDIAEFKTLDASSNLKSAKYTEISQKLEFLEEQ